MGSLLLLIISKTLVKRLQGGGIQGRTEAFQVFRQRGKAGDEKLKPTISVETQKWEPLQALIHEHVPLYSVASRRRRFRRETSTRKSTVQGPLGGTPTRCVGKGPRISPHGSPGAWITSGEGNGWECINGTPASTCTIGEAAHHNYIVPIKTSSLRGRHGGAACD
uniref:Uncharacterized protein n=1 Tax=Setaria viridis TaxID=4556 RepID=A0A4U6T2J1_SETVI|nr:hypothetical protein SEVIR_9G310000v2 [Setaria viridis]